MTVSGQIPAITVVVPTRDRGDSVLMLLRTLLESGYPTLNMRIVDQSPGDATTRAVAPSLSDPRVRYLRTSSQGLSMALNEGVRGVKTELVAITGDDCEVQRDWLERLVAGFAVDRRTGVIFGNVVPGAHDRTLGFVPGSVRRAPVLVRHVRDKYRLGGTSACMAFRRSVWEALKGFDEMLGVGSPLQAGEDVDFTIRALLTGHAVYKTPEAVVVHHGLVRWEQRSHLIRRNWYGTGAAFAKALCRDRQMIPALMWLAWNWATRGSQVAGSLGDGPYRIPSLIAFSRAFVAGVLTPVDPASGHFRPRRAAGSRPG